MNIRSVFLLIALMTAATTCVAEVPCQARLLSDLMGTRCLLGNVMFSPFILNGDEPRVYYKIYYFQPDTTDPNNPGFTLSKFSYVTPPPLVSVTSKSDPSFPYPNHDEVSFGYIAELPCSGAICETAFAPVITAVATVATNYSVDLSGFPAGFGYGVSTVVVDASGLVDASGFGNCGDGGRVTATAGLQVDNERGGYNNNITWGPINSAAFGCAQHRIEGTVRVLAETNQCSTCDTLSTVSMDSASVYFHTRTMQAFANGDTGGGASQPLPSILDPMVAFSAFSNKLQATSSGFQLASTFTLGNTSGGINPVTDPIALQVGSYAVVFPAGALHMAKKGYYVYQGPLNDDSIQLQIVLGTKGTHTLKAEVTAGTPIALENPALIALTIGNDFGATNIVPGN